MNYLMDTKLIMEGVKERVEPIRRQREEQRLQPPQPGKVARLKLWLLRRGRQAQSPHVSPIDESLRPRCC